MKLKSSLQEEISKLKWNETKSLYINKLTRRADPS